MKLQEIRTLISSFQILEEAYKKNEYKAIFKIKKLGIYQTIISSELNPVVSVRASKLGIPCLQGINNKKDRVNLQKKSYQNKQIGNIALRKLIQKNPKKRYLANVNPKNKKSIRFFKNNGFKLIQYTFELSKIKN